MKVFRSCFVLTCVLCIVFSSCQKQQIANEATDKFSTLALKDSRMAKAVSKNTVLLAADSVTDVGLNQNVTENQSERKLIKTGNVTVEVASVKNVESLVEEWCASFGAYVSYSNSTQSDSSFTIQVPSDRFDEAMSSFGNFGTVKSHSVQTQDVSEQFYDLQTRISNKKIMRDNLKKYLIQAKDIKDLLQIEKELNNVLSDIESMEGRLKRLSNQIDFSSIYVTFQLSPGKSEVFTPALNDAVKAFGRNVAAFFVSCIVVFFYVIVCGIPVVLILSFLFWLLWGKIGLLRKLFHFLSD